MSKGLQWINVEKGRVLMLECHNCGYSFIPVLTDENTNGDDCPKCDVHVSIKQKVYTIPEILEKFNIDRRKHWFIWSGTVCRNIKETMPCPYCDGSKCDMCGYQGKMVDNWPIPFINPETDNPLLVQGKNLTKL